MNDLKLYMILLGAKPLGRNTEQHDVFFGIARKLKDLASDIRDFWPDAGKSIHIDAWREVNYVNGHQIKILTRTTKDYIQSDEKNPQLFFINLGGYKSGEFEEFHYKMLIIDISKAKAIYKSKKSAFYKQIGFKGAPSHIDDKYGIDVDDICEVQEVLNEKYKANYSISISQTANLKEDEFQLGFLCLNKL